MTTTAAEPDAKPRRFGWLRPPKHESVDGTMSLLDHLREIRYRVTISAITVLLTSIAAIFFYRQIIGVVMRPYYEAKDQILANNPNAMTLVTNNGVSSPFTLAVMTCVLAGVLLACPVWIYQLWAFIAPGLLLKEKKYALGFMAAGVPLFLLGCLVGYLVWPKGIAVMLSFTLSDMQITNILEMGSFLATEIKVVLVFGISFLLPVVLVGLNLAGVIKGYQLGKSRRYVIFGLCVFAAVATPSTDPFSMLALFVPMTLLFLISEIICRVLDKRKGITEKSAKEFAIDIDDGK